MAAFNSERQDISYLMQVLSAQPRTFHNIVLYTPSSFKPLYLQLLHAQQQQLSTELKKHLTS